MKFRFILLIFIIGVLDRFHENLIRNISETALAAAMHKRTAILINLQELHNGGQVKKYTLIFMTKQIIF